MRIYPLTEKRSRRAALGPMIGWVLAALFLPVALTSCQNPPPLSDPSSPTSDSPGHETVTAAPQGEVLIADRARVAPDASAAEIRDLVVGNNAFAVDLYQAIRNGEENLLYSPFSISQALAMLYGGAQGVTAQQMAETLHFTLPPERLHSAFNALDSRLVSKDQATGQPDAFTLHVANALWGQKGLSYRDEFLAALAQNYGAGVHLADLQGDPAAAVEAINRWADQETRGRIPQVLNKLSPDAAIVLANAIYFNAAWELPFEERNTYDEPFHLLDGRQKDVPIMHQWEALRHGSGDGFQAVALPYTGRSAAMVIILPEDGRFREIEQLLSAGWVDELQVTMQEGEVRLTMPKFTYAPDLDLAETLRSMGMPDAFSPEAADFSGMIADPVPVWIGGVLHKSFIDVDEHKSEAAAVTVVEMAAGAAQPPPTTDITIDRPFIYLITDRDTGAILFVGRVMDPAPAD
jgi:serpin B